MNRAASAACVADTGLAHATCTAHPFSHGTFFAASCAVATRLTSPTLAYAASAVQN